ncbi:hypothetical protein NEFER03_1055 [Nematocida sp. LUAm3]|nr:hypothetical protein NEFER03_1055 [Nematocida sp. LUAm3]KAI5175340.1 hypothetical protein NEFER02_1269 [Nematocida sp. LUAm2]KAI5177703.1 hypothetical protein NEFER01_0927 [Nematocida sp. LUAm1]
MEQEIEELSTSFSTIVIENSSRSLIDISWLSPAAIQERHPVYLPKWMEMEGYATHESNSIKVLANEKYYEFPVEGYPSTQEKVHSLKASIESEDKRRKMEKNRKEEDLVKSSGSSHPEPPQKEKEPMSIDANTNTQLLFFLWNREEIEGEIAEKNISVIKADIYAKYFGRAEKAQASLSDIEHPEKICALLWRLSLEYGVSFVFLSKSTLNYALASLTKALEHTGDKSEPCIRIKKRSAPEDLLKSTLQAVPGIFRTEVDIIMEKYKSVYEIMYAIEHQQFLCEGVREKACKQIISFFLE